METNAIHADQRNGNLHLNLHGDFTTETALRLTSTIARTYSGRGNIFIHTAQVAAVRFPDPAAPAESTPLDDDEYPTLGVVHIEDVTK